MSRADPVLSRIAGMMLAGWRRTTRVGAGAAREPHTC